MTQTIQILQSLQDEESTLLQLYLVLRQQHDCDQPYSTWHGRAIEQRFCTYTHLLNTKFSHIQNVLRGINELGPIFPLPVERLL